MTRFWIWLAVYIPLGLANPISGLTVPIFFAIRPPTLHTALNIAAGYLLISLIAVGCLTFVPVVAFFVIALPLVQCLVYWRVRLAWVQRHDEPGADDDSVDESIDVEDI